MKRIIFTKLQLLLCFGLLCMASLTYAQQRVVSGRVTDSSGNGLSGVTVTVAGASTQAQTDDGGNYRINASTGQTLVFSLVGMQRREIVLGQSPTLNVTLEESTEAIEEVAITAFGIQRQSRSLGYTAQTVNSEELNFNRQPNVVNALQGKTAGVQIRSTGGAPGQGAKIQIRGINSIDPNRDNSPLFVIDGVIMDNSTSTQGSQASARGMSNRAVDVNPDDIETINILRGGAATALYGLRGANGVVVITTKSGKVGSIQVNYQGSYGIDEVNKFPEVQSVYTQGWSGEYDPNSFWPSFGPTVAEARALDPTHPAQLYNHFKDAYQTGQQYKNNLSISGGTEKLTFMSSISHFGQEGVMPFTDFKNIQGRLNTTVRPSDKFTVSTNMTVSNSGGDRGNAIRFNEQLTYWSPRWDVRDYKKEDGTMFMPYPGLSNNPIYVAETNKFQDDVLRFIGSTKFDYKPFDWLNFSYLFGVDTYRDNRRRFAPGFQGLDGEIRVSENGGTGTPGTGFLYVYENKQLTFNSTFLVNLSHKFSDSFSGNLLLGNDLYDRNIYRSAMEGWDFAIWNWFSLANANRLAAGTYEEDYRLMGNFFDVSFNYKDFLYLNVTGRNDITSSLLRPRNSFFYPSVNMSYILSDHLNLPSVIDYAKLRASYAQVGKDADPYSTSLGFASYGSLPTGYTGFTRPALLGNPLLRPEFTDTYEAGLELNFFNRRLTFDGNYYHTVSQDQILRVPISTATGHATSSTNIGSLENKGIELTIGGTPVRTSDFTWTSQFNFSANRNKVRSITGDLGEEIVVYSESGYLSSTVSMRIIPGESYGTLYGRSYVRYYSPEEIAAGLDQSLKIDQSRPIVIGANGFPELQPAANIKQLGNVLPTWIGGWFNTFQYKNVALSVLFDGQFGQYAYNQLDNFFSSFGQGTYSLNRNDYVVFDGVLADGTPNTQEVWLGQGIDPETGRNYGNGYYRDNHRGNSEFFVQDASWLKLRSLSIDYSLPTKWLPRNFIKNASVSFTGNNLWIWTKFNGYDPESSTTNSGSNVEGFAGFTYPGIRNYLFTLNVGF